MYTAAMHSLTAVGHRHIKAAAIVVSSIILFAVMLVRSPIGAEEFMSNTLDHSWIISLSAMLQQGMISGRDFHYTYGVLTQVIAQLGVALVPGQSPIDGYFSILMCFRAFSIFLLGVILGLIRQVTWRQAVGIIFMLGLLNTMFDIAAPRMLLLLLTAVVLARALSAQVRSRQLGLSVIVGLLCLIGQLFTAELGILSTASIVLLLITYAACSRFHIFLHQTDLLTSRSYLSVLGAIITTFLLGNLVISLLFKLSSSTYSRLFDYQFYSLELIRGYNNTMGIAWIPSAFFLAGLLIILACILLSVLFNLPRLAMADGYLLSSLLITALVAAKGMLLRSDWGHTTIGLFPLIFLLLILGPGWFQSSRVRLSWVGSMAVLLMIWPGADFSALTTVPKIFDSDKGFVPKMNEIISMSIPVDKLVPIDLKQSISAQPNSILVFPYQNYLAIALDRSLVAPVLQAFIANTEALQQEYVASLAGLRLPPLVIYGLDSVVSWPVDGVQNITRVPVIFEYLYRNYELSSSQPYGQGYYLLKPRSQPVNFQMTSLLFTAEKLDSAHLQIKLDNPVRCSLVQLNLQINYPITSFIGRPDALHVQFLHGQTEKEGSDLVAIETGKEFATYVSLIDAANFYQVFGADQVQTKNWDELRIGPRTTGPFEVFPSLVDVKSIGCITFATGSASP